MVYCKELNKEFNSKAEMFKALRESHKDIIADKTAKIYNCESGSQDKCSIKLKSINPSKLDTQIKGLDIDDAYYYLAVNTTKILDSHRDLHLNNIWNKTAKEQQGKLYLVWDHELKGGSTIVKKEDIQLVIADIPFSLIGQLYEGNTQALVYKFRKDRIIDLKAKEWLESGDEIQASVRMQYVKILFALDSKEEEDKEFKKNYDKYYSEIANKDDFEGIEYFWPVLEAKNVLESSLVLFGSNHATGVIQEDNKTQPPQSTDEKDKNEPSKDTQREFMLNYLKNQ